MRTTLGVIAAIATLAGCGEFRHEVGDLPTGVWTKVEQVQSSPLRAVHAVSASEVYYGGEDGALLHRVDGVTTPILNYGSGTVRAIAVTTDGELLAGGDDGQRGGKLNRWIDGELYDMFQPEIVNGLWTTPDAGTYIVGGVGEGFASRWENSDFMHETLPSTYPWFTGVSATSGSRAFVVHSQGVLRTAYGEWEDVPLDVTVLPSGAVFAHLANDFEYLFLGGGEGVLAVRTPEGWTRHEVGSGTWTSIWGSSHEDVWAVGAGGAIAHFDGTAWELVESPTQSLLSAVHGTADGHAFAVGQDGALYGYVPAEPRQLDVAGAR